MKPIQFTHAKGLDLTHLHADGTTKIAAYTTKKHAAAFAKECGWQANDVYKGFSRFFRFYVVGQIIGNKVRILLIDRTWRDFPFDKPEGYSVAKGRPAAGEPAGDEG